MSPTPLLKSITCSQPVLSHLYKNPYFIIIPKNERVEEGIQNIKEEWTYFRIGFVREVVGLSSILSDDGDIRNGEGIPKNSLNEFNKEDF
jgi:hypothetical protein